MAALERLPPAQREAVALTKLGGKSIAEAAGSSAPRRAR
ncbi:MAG: hypothetical protein HS111_30570 [Kofleriaceae bacterium]|nr:hypothetical protein [Kofleriaceae bacterium]